MTSDIHTSILHKDIATLFRIMWPCAQINFLFKIREQLNCKKGRNKIIRQPFFYAHQTQPYYPAIESYIYPKSWSEKGQNLIKVYYVSLNLYQNGRCSLSLLKNLCLDKCLTLPKMDTNHIAFVAFLDFFASTSNLIIVPA